MTPPTPWEEEFDFRWNPRKPIPEKDSQEIKDFITTLIASREEQSRTLLLSLLKPTHTIHGFDKHANSHDMIWNKAVREIAAKLGVVL